MHAATLRIKRGGNSVFLYTFLFLFGFLLRYIYCTFSFLSLKPYFMCLEYYTTCEVEEGEICIQVAVETVCPAVASASATKFASL